MKLNKVVYNEYCRDIVNINLKECIDKNIVKFGDKIWNYRDNIVLIERDNNLYYWSRFSNTLNIVKEKYFVVPINGYGIYKTINIFSQNNDQTAYSIYNIVLELLNDLITDLCIYNKIINLYGIGGEFYVYFRILKFKYEKNKYHKIIYNGYSNNQDVLDVSKKNNSCSNYNLINYNTYNFDMKYNGLTLINLSKINNNILKNLKTKYVVSITCKDKFLNNYTRALKIKKVFYLNNVKITIFKII